MKRIAIVAARAQSEHGELDKLARFYPQAVARAGGIPLVLPSCHADPQHYAGLYDALVLTGCEADIAPQSYGEPLSNARYCDPERDAWEIAMYHQAKQAAVPILGICRGMQLINVAEGGTLHQDIADMSDLEHWEFARHTEHIHQVVIESSRILTDGEYAVNSIHHQAVERLGAELVVTGTAADGMIELIEHHQLPIIGTQWHPERLIDDTLSQELFRWLTRS